MRSKGKFTTGVIVEEFIANTKAGFVRVVIVALIAAAAGFAQSALTVNEVVRAQDALQQADSSGQFSWRVSDRDGKLSAAACDSLQSIEGVRSAGAIMSSVTLTPANQPGLSYALHTTTPGYLAAIWPHELQTTSAATTDGIVAGAIVGERLGLRNGTILTAHQRGNEQLLLPVSAVLPPSERAPRADRALYLSAPATGMVDECIVDIDPAYAAGMDLILASQLDRGATIAPYLHARSTDADPQELLDQRASRFGWIAAATVVSLTVLGFWYARRTDFALYRLLGATTRPILQLFALDLVVIAGIWLNAGWLGGLLLTDPAGAAEPLWRILWFDISRIWLVLAVVPLVGLVLTRPSKTLDTLKGS